jgi:hypothetical protein
MFVLLVKYIQSYYVHDKPDYNVSTRNLLYNLKKCFKDSMKG